MRVLDSLDRQVHENGQPPAYLHPEVELIIGDVCDRKAVDASLEGVNAVFHLAAAVGVGQSMYEIRHYTHTNNIGTANLLEALMDQPVEKLVTASSMSLYGEGLYTDRQGKLFRYCQRSPQDLRQSKWELYDPSGNVLEPVAVTEDKPPQLSSVYALSKFDQERLCLMTGAAYNIPATALRFFNVYGPRQSLSNPYTGVLAIFASRLLNNNQPLIFEDGYQMRDFIHVKDVARACRLALESPGSDGEAINIGSGERYSIKQLADTLMTVMGQTSTACKITGKYRMGDIRHCFADISKAKELLGFYPQITLEEGMKELAEWLEDQIAIDRVDIAKNELESRGLTV